MMNTPMEYSNAAAVTTMPEEEGLEDDEDAFTGVELGFLQEPPPNCRLLHRDPDFRTWDGGKAGGFPVWLDPSAAPPPSSLTCGRCAKVMTFLVQVYAPLDPDVSHGDAFHRSLYLFCCRDRACVRQGRGVKAVRCQLPRENPIYAGDPSVFSSDGDGAEVPSAAYENRALVLDELHASANTAYSAAADDAATSEGGSSNLLMKEFRITIESERAADVDVGDDDDDDDDDGGGGGVDLDAAALADDNVFCEQVNQNTLDAMAGGDGRTPSRKKDWAFIRFQNRVAKNQGQCLRYARWDDGAALWVSASALPGENGIPYCPRCGAERKFEFQVLPQLLGNFLDIWGTMAVYTCSKSCSPTFVPMGQTHLTTTNRAAYLDEFVFVNLESSEDDNGTMQK